MTDSKRGKIIIITFICAYSLMCMSLGALVYRLSESDKLTPAECINQAAIAWRSATQPRPVIHVVEKRMFDYSDLPKISANMLPELPANGRLK